jgi:hypothetical protein
MAQAQTNIITWNPRTNQDYEQLKGKPVFDPDLREVGQLCAVFYPPDETMPTARGQHYFLVETGVNANEFGEDELYLAEGDVRGLLENGIVLDIPRSRLSGEIGRAPGNLNGFRRS